MSYHYTEPPFSESAERRLEQQAEPPYDPRSEVEPDDVAAAIDEWSGAYERANGVPPTHITEDGVHFRRLLDGKIEFLCEHGIVGHGCDPALVQGPDGEVYATDFETKWRP